MATIPSTVSAAHHYVPKFYLKGFMDEKKTLWVYEKGRPPRASKPKEEAHRENYYLFDDKGYPDDSAEKSLSSIESIVAPLFRKLANPQFQLSDQQCTELYTFVAMTFVRVPAFREYLDRTFGKMMKALTMEHARDPAKFAAVCQDYETNTGIKVPDREKVRKFALEGNYEVSQHSVGYNIRQTFETGLAITEILEKEYSHELLYPPKGSFFMTCDNPVTTLYPDGKGEAFVGVGFGWQRTEVLFPINKRVCMVLRRSGKKGNIQITEQGTEQINNLIMGIAQQCLYAPRGYRRISRLFDERGARIKYGENALMPGLPSTSR